MPVFCNILHATRDAATSCSKGNIELAYCHNCTHIFNTQFDEKKMHYTQQYENALHWSPRFQVFAKQLAQQLIDRYTIRNKHVIDIGCGKGDFLILLSKLGNNTGTGFDPSYEDRPHSEQVSFIQDIYSEKYTEKADMLCCRHVLEHVNSPASFLQNFSPAIKPSTILYFEVPNALYTLKDLGIWDIIYEHPSYFTAGSLGYLFSESGLHIIKLAESFGGQYLGIESTPGASTNKIESIYQYVKTFAQYYQNKVKFWNEEVKKYQKIVAWGAGSKGVMFLNTVENNMEYIVDLNPAKQGKYVAGTGQKIVAPEFLKSYQPELVLVMNPLYKEEIQAKLNELGVTAKVICV